MTSKITEENRTIATRTATQTHEMLIIPTTSTHCKYLRTGSDSIINYYEIGVSKTKSTNNITA